MNSFPWKSSQAARVGSDLRAGRSELSTVRSARPKVGSYLRTAMQACLLALTFGFVGALAGAAPLERDLGQGLKYFRLKQLPGDLPAQSEISPITPVVVDVRYLPAEPEEAATLDAWLRFRASPKAPVFLLANSDTSPALLRLLSQREPGTGMVVIAARSRQLEPDISVPVSRENEQRAYAALAEGVPVTVLLTDNPDKVRNDEASLSRDRLAESSAESTSSEPAAKGPRPPLDVALQRAVHLHRALLALKKI